MMEDKLTLVQLQQQIGEAVIGSLPESVWITAEISSVTERSNGHCYIELAEYSEENAELCAKARAIIWSSQYRILKPFFETTAGRPLEQGMHILFHAQVQYSSIYGLNLIISDIDPSYTIGESELKRQRTIERLKAEGMFEMNSTLALPVLPKKFAVISSDTAAGYKDFIKHLHSNEFGFHFRTQLFPAIMQGKEAPESIISAMDTIAEALNSDTTKYDAVIIVRGGGSVIDLSCFDDYNLAANIAQFPIPVITGVGHDIDFHICDMVAYKWLKTPTAVADYILELFITESAMLDSIKNRIAIALTAKIRSQSMMLDMALSKIKNICSARIEEEKNRINLYEVRLNGIIPNEILQRGFGIIYSNDVRINRVGELKAGDEITILMQDGKATFTIQNVKFNKQI